MGKLSVQFGEIFDKVNQPNPVPKKKFKCIGSALDDYLDFFTNEESCPEFSLWTHTFGPAVLKHVVHSIKKYLANVIEVNRAEMK